MPTYEYRCTSCDYYFEQFQSIKAEPIKICPKCGEPVRKLFSAGAGLIFKGSGFYITDYKKNNVSAPSNGNGKANESGSSDKSDKTIPSEKKTVPDPKK